MYFHNSLIPRSAYFILPLESKQEATSGWNFTKCISEVKFNQLKVKKYTSHHLYIFQTERFSAVKFAMGYEKYDLSCDTKISKSLEKKLKR